MARHALDGDPLVIEMREIDRHVRSGMGARSHQTAIHADCPESLWQHPRISDVVVQHVDALAVGDFHHFGDNFLRGVIDAEISAKLLAEYDALVSPGNRDHARFKHVLGYLDTDGAEIAAGAHYQHGLAGFQRCDMYEQIPRRRHVAQHHRGAMKIETLGNGDCGAGGNSDLLGEATGAMNAHHSSWSDIVLSVLGAGLERHETRRGDVVAHVPAGNLRADGVDDAGAIDTWNKG